MITGTVTGAVVEGNVGDAPVTASGTISISDVDDDDSPVFNDVASTLGDNAYGSFTLTAGTWAYTLDQIGGPKSRCGQYRQRHDHLHRDGWKQSTDYRHDHG